MVKAKEVVQLFIKDTIEDFNGLMVNYWTNAATCPTLFILHRESYYQLGNL